MAMDDGMDFDEMFPGRFMKAGEFQGRELTFTIIGHRKEMLSSDKGGESEKNIITVRETKKEWVMNRTNGACLMGMFGRHSKAWMGKRVTLYPTSVRFGKGTELAIRVKGSPDIAADMEFDIRLPKKKPISVRMYATGRRTAPSTEATKAEEPIPSFDELQGGAR